MNVGDLRHRVKIQNATQAADGMGGVTETYTTTATVFASVRPISARERLFAQAHYATATHQVRMRYTKAITNRSRLLLGTRKLHVLSVLNVDERDREQVAICEEKL